MRAIVSGYLARKIFKGGESLLERLVMMAWLLKLNLWYLVYHVSEYINDCRYGIDTRTSFRGVQSLDHLTILGERAGANPYAPTPYGTIKRIIRSLPADRSQYTFIDFGSGKGRVIQVA